MERIFFHDILNTAGGILGYTQILRDAEPEELTIFSESIEELSKRLIEEIQAQKQLIAAEGGKLDIRQQPIEHSKDSYKKRLNSLKIMSSLKAKRLLPEVCWILT
ncbi:MAG: hypothetical protein IPJ75_08180 [Ignavibacteriales bacterium]|nr:hypothetical protein [Ignavibacteriales bacterium]